MEEDRGLGLVLRRGRHPLRDREVGQEPSTSAAPTGLSFTDSDLRRCVCFSALVRGYYNSPKYLFLGSGLS
jgi:hypothetical protein